MESVKTAHIYRYALTLFSMLWLSANGYAKAASPWNFDIWAGTGYLAGDMNYQIGNKVLDQGEWFKINDPLSKLEFPFKVMTVTAKGTAEYSELMEIGLSYSRNITDPGINMKDSDWTDESNPSLLTIYSESNAALKGYTVDGNIKFWVYKTINEETGKLQSAFGPGAGYSYQNLSWVASNVDQWYPPTPDDPHIYVAGPAITYDAEVYSPYVGLFGKLNTAGVSLSGNVGWCYVATHEVDNHLLRDKISTTDGTGQGIKAAVSAKFMLDKSLYLLADANLFSFKVTGTQHQYLYGVETFLIDDTTRSTQLMGTLGLGYMF